MLLFGVPAFGAAVFFISFAVASASRGDQGKVATQVTLIAWGSLLCGLCLAGAVQ